MNQIYFFFVFLFFYMPIFFSQPSPPIPTERTVDWSNAGLTISRPTYYDYIIDVSQYNVVPGGNFNTWSSNVQGLRNAINFAASLDTSKWKCIYFSQEGEYGFDAEILITDSCKRIVFKGTYGNGVFSYNPKVTLIFYNPDGFGQYNPEHKSLFVVTGRYGTISTAPSCLKNQNSFILPLVNDIQANDFIDFSDERPNGINGIGLPPPEWSRVGQIFEVDHISNNTAYLKDKFGINMNVAQNWVRKLYPVKYIGFEGLKIIAGFSNYYYENGKSCNIKFDNAVNCWVYGVESSNTWGWHIGVTRSAHIWIHGNVFHDAIEYSAGMGYGVVCQTRSSNCLIENNIFHDLRHSMLVQAGAIKNVYSYNLSYARHSSWYEPYLADLCIHGTYPNANLFEGNIVQMISADDSHGGNNGYFQTFFRNSNTVDDVELFRTYSANYVGNVSVSLPNFDESPNGLDIYGYLNGDVNQPKDHFYHTWNPQDNLYYNVASLYLPAMPLWWSGISLTWPAIGPNLTNGSASCLNRIPALFRNNNISSKTVYTDNPKTIITLTNGQYKINGSYMNIFYPYFNENVTIQAFNANAGATFVKWSDGNTQNPRTIQVKKSTILSAIWQYNNEENNAVETSVVEAEDYILNQNYPNPFNPNTKIHYSIKEDGFVSLKIYDVLANEVKTLVNENKSIGKYEIDFNASDLPSGIYLYELQVNEFVDIKKMIYIK